MAARSKALALATRIIAPRAVLPVRGGGGGPVPFEKPANAPLFEEDELVWRDGSVYPEPCLDQFTLVTKWEALGYMSAGLLFFVGLGYAAKLNNKAATVPYAPKEFPYDNLAVELGRSPKS